MKILSPSTIIPYFLWVNRNLKNFLFQINNKNIRDNLINQHKQEFPENFTFSQKWNLAFQHLWRKELRHLANYPKAKIRNDDFLPIVNEAKEYGIQWKVTKLVAVEVLVPVSWEKGRFLIKKDLNIDGNNSLFFSTQPELPFRIG